MALVSDQMRWKTWKEGRKEQELEKEGREGRRRRRTILWGKWRRAQNMSIDILIGLLTLNGFVINYLKINNGIGDDNSK